MPDGMEPPYLPAWRNIAPAELALRRRLFRPVGPIELDIGGTAARLEFAGEAQGMPLGFSAEVQIGAERAGLELPGDLIRALVRSVHPSEPPTALDGDVLALVLELALIEPIEALERRQGLLIRVLALRQGQAPASGCLRLSGRLTLDDRDFAVVVALPLQAVEPVAALLPRARPDRARLGLTAPLACELGRSWIAAGDLRRLALGDVVLPTEALRPADRPRLTLADRWQADAALAGRVLTLTSALGPVPIQEEPPMTDETIPVGPDHRFDDLPVRLVFEAGRIEVSLASLDALTPGQVLTLPGDAAAPIDILANGRRIGGGELVRIGERVGIRIVGLGPHG